MQIQLAPTAPSSRRVFLDLREAVRPCGKNRVERIMRLNYIKAVRCYKAPKTVYGRPSIIALNRLQREFTIDKTDKAG